ncbi:MAG: hypothetical protein ACE5DY_06930 [Mariprofundaceae bacterium]
MHKWLLLLISLFFWQAPPAFAQKPVPTDDQITSDLTAKADKNALVSFRITSTRKSIKSEVENGVIVLNYYRFYESKSRSEYPGVLKVYRGGVKYGYRNGNWIFVQKLVGDFHYEGFKDPEWSTLKPFLLKHIKDILGARYAYIVGDIENFRLADNPDWYWHTPASVEFVVNMTYSEKINNSELQKTNQDYKVRLYADKHGAPWHDKLVASAKGQGKKLALKKYDADELKRMKTLKQEEIEKIAQSENANLPDVKVPDFANQGQLMLYVHKLMLKADQPTIEAALRKLISPGYFAPDMDNVLTHQGANLIDTVKVNAMLYRKQYCPQPVMKQFQSNMAEWFNKNATSYARISSQASGNTRKIASISLGVNKSNSRSALEALPCKPRSHPLQRMCQTRLQTKKGTPVFSRYGKSEWWYVGRVNGIAGDTAKVEWLDGSNSNEPVKTTCNFSLKPGDLVYIKDRGNIQRRWVAEYKGSMQVKLEDIQGRTSMMNLKDLRFK